MHTMFQVLFVGINALVLVLNQFVIVVKKVLANMMTTIVAFQKMSLVKGWVKIITQQM